MKKVVALFVMVVVLLSSCAVAEDIDLSTLSFNELVALREKINLAIWECDEWQEVVVPQGTWRVGEDIPAGTWTIKCTGSDSDYTKILVTDCVDSTGTTIDFEKAKYIVESGLIYNNEFYDAHPDYSHGDQYQYNVTLKDGDYVIIDCSSATFVTYTGKPDDKVQ